VLEEFGAVPRGGHARCVEGTGKAVRYATLKSPLPDALPPGFRLRVGTTFPTLALLDETGNEVLLDPKALAGGEKLYVNFWATFCGSCVKEIPDLQALDETPEARVVSISMDAPAERERSHALLKKRGGRFTAYYLGSEREASSGPSRVEELVDVERLPLPSTVVVLPDGTIESIVTGLLRRE
jgi:thiol-disulfide isomerase/thioredoxin